MAYKALYRSYRPNSFNSVIGQEHIIQTLKNALINNKTSHAYIFSGPRGIGKTTIARILAKAINCEDLQNGEPCNKCTACKLVNSNETPDIVEFDAASNNGVEEIRNVLEKVNFLPSVLKHKVYIIDEVHMLSISAFNALLKTLEEPPAHVLFILATTEVHKIPATILSRCQRFDFKPLTVKEIKNNLKDISEKEKIDIEEEAINLVAEAADGGMRDAISILDQVNAYSTKTITVEDVNNVTGRISNQKIIELMQAIKDNNSIKAVEIANELVSLGKEVSRLVQSLLQLCRDILLYQNTSGEIEGKLIYDDMAFKMLCNALNKRKIFYYIDVLSDIQNKIKFSLSQKIFLEVGIMKMATANNEDFGSGMVNVASDVSSDVEDRVSTLEAQLNKVKSELVHLNLAEFKNTTQEKLDSLEDAANNTVVAIPNDLSERIEKIEHKLREQQNHNIGELTKEIELIKTQLNDNNNYDDEENEVFEKINILEESINLMNEKIEEINMYPSNSLNEEWLKYEDSIKLIANQVEELNEKLQVLEEKVTAGPTLLDFNGEQSDEILRITNECNQLKEDIESLQNYYTNIEETLNKLLVDESTKEVQIQKRDNPYEQKVQDIVDEHASIIDTENQEENVDENLDEEKLPVQQEIFAYLETNETEDEGDEETNEAEDEGNEETNEAEDEGDEEIDEAEDEGDEEKDEAEDEGDEETDEAEDEGDEETDEAEDEGDEETDEDEPESFQDKLEDIIEDLVGDKAEEIVEKLVSEVVGELVEGLDEEEAEDLIEDIIEEVTDEIVEEIAEGLIDRLGDVEESDEDEEITEEVKEGSSETEEPEDENSEDNENSKEIPSPVEEPKETNIEGDTENNNNLDLYVKPVELHYELNCDVKQLEKDLHVANLAIEVPQEVLNRISYGLVGMKDDVIAFTNDKINGVYNKEETLEADAKRNVKTFLIMLSSRDVNGVVTKYSEIAALVSEVKAAIDLYRKAIRGLPTNLAPQQTEVVKPIVEEPPVTVLEEPKTDELQEEQPSNLETPSEQLETNQEPEQLVKDEDTNTPEPETPIPAPVEVKPEQPKEVVINKVEIDEDPYAISKIEAVMHDSRSEISREERKIILNNWNRLGDRVNTALLPVAQFLMDGQPVVNGNNCIIISYPNAALCNYIMSDKVRFEAKQILKITFGREYDFIALPEDVWQEKRNEYRGQYQMGTRFPKLTPINNPELKVIKNSFVDDKGESYNQAVDLFGTNLIKEEED